MRGARRTAIPHFQVLDKICVETHRKPSFVLELARVSVNSKLHVALKTGLSQLVYGRKSTFSFS